MNENELLYGKVIRRLNQAGLGPTDPAIKETIRGKMAEAQAAYKELTQQESKINKDIALIDSQIKDITSAYDIDESPKDKLDKAMGHVERGADGKFHPIIEPDTLFVTSSGGN